MDTIKDIHFRNPPDYINKKNLEYDWSTLLDEETNEWFIETLPKKKLVSLSTVAAELYIFDRERHEWEILYKGTMCILKDYNTKTYYLRMFRPGILTAFDWKANLPVPYRERTKLFHEFKAGDAIYGIGFYDQEEAKKFINTLTILRKETYLTELSPKSVSPILSTGFNSRDRTPPSPSAVSNLSKSDVYNPHLPSSSASSKQNPSTSQQASGFASTQPTRQLQSGDSNRPKKLSSKSIASNLPADFNIRDRTPSPLAKSKSKRSTKMDIDFPNLASSFVSLLRNPSTSQQTSGASSAQSVAKPTQQFQSGDNNRSRRRSLKSSTSNLPAGFTTRDRTPSPLAESHFPQSSKMDIDSQHLPSSLVSLKKIQPPIKPPRGIPYVEPVVKRQLQSSVENKSKRLSCPNLLTQMLNKKKEINKVETSSSRSSSASSMQDLSPSPARTPSPPPAFERYTPVRYLGPNLLPRLVEARRSLRVVPKKDDENLPPMTTSTTSSKSFAGKNQKAAPAIISRLPQSIKMNVPNPPLPPYIHTYRAKTSNLNAREYAQPSATTQAAAQSNEKPTRLSESSVDNKPRRRSISNFFTKFLDKRKSNNQKPESESFFSRFTSPRRSRRPPPAAISPVSQTHKAKVQSSGLPSSTIPPPPPLPSEPLLRNLKEPKKAKNKRLSKQLIKGKKKLKKVLPEQQRISNNMREISGIENIIQKQLSKMSYDKTERKKDEDEEYDEEWEI